MPVHLSSFVPENKSDAVFTDLVSMTNSSSVVCASEDKKYLHLQKDLMDAIKGEPFGRVVFTVKINDATKSLNIIDVDIVLENDRTTELELITKLLQSSDANEYYDADVVDGGRIQVETVNRYAFKGELEGATHSFRLSAFPFSVDIFDSMDEINKRFSFGSSVKVEEEEMKVSGFADTFVCPGSMFHPEDLNGETFTYFFGKVNAIRNVECRDFSEPLSFYIVDVVSGMGIIPVAMSPECFDLSKLAIGKTLEIRADIKADLIDDAPEKE